MIETVKTRIPQIETIERTALAYYDQAKGFTMETY